MQRNKTSILMIVRFVSKITHTYQSVKSNKKFTILAAFEL